MDFIKKICVCGAGTMGSGIAQLSAQKGFDVIQYDVNADMLSKSRKNIGDGFKKLVEKGKLLADQKEALLRRIVFTTNIDDCIADVIIEAVIENREIKMQLFDSLYKINNPETIFATNTSSISVSELSEAGGNTQLFAGMHFFNPAPVMQLVEIIRTAKTSDNTIRTLVELAKQLGKTPVVCNDAPGFIVNRVARHYYLEAMHMIEAGATDIQTIDAVMEATGFKMGPFKLMDLIGLDVNYSVTNIVWEALGKPDRLRPSALQKEKVEAGELGRKTGKGFYNY